MNQQICSCDPHPRTRKGARAADAARRADNPLHGAGHSACRPHSPRLRPPLQLPQRPQQAGVGIKLRPLLHHQTQLLCACVSTSLQQPARPTLMSAAPSSPSAAMVSSGVCNAHLGVQGGELVSLTVVASPALTTLPKRSTLSVAEDSTGFPFGSIVGYADDEATGAPIFVFSTMSAHTKDIMQVRLLAMLGPGSMVKLPPPTTQNPISAHCSPLVL